MKWPYSDVLSLASEGWPKVRQMTGLDSLKVAEGRVAFDVVLLLEAVKLGWVHVHPCQYLKRKTKENEVRVVLEWRKSEGRETRKRKDMKHHNRSVIIRGLQNKKRWITSSMKSDSTEKQHEVNEC